MHILVSVVVLCINTARDDEFGRSVQLSCTVIIPVSVVDDNTCREGTGIGLLVSSPNKKIIHVEFVSTWCMVSRHVFNSRG